MKKPFSIIATLLVLAVGGCALQVDVETERAAIREFHDVCLAAQLTGSVDCFAENGQMLLSGSPPIKGRNAIGDGVAQMIADPNFSISHDIVNVDVSHSGELAYIHYTFEFIMSGPDGNPAIEQGNAVYVMKKQPHLGWKILIDISNSGPGGGH